MADRLRVLVVDDDDVDRKLVRRLLRRGELNVDVSEALDADQATRFIISDQPPDCMLLDYLLPGTDGLEFVRELRENDHQVPIIVMTGQGDERLAVAERSRQPFGSVERGEMSRPTLE